MKVKTFAELEKAEIVTLEELQTSLEDYAAGGWAISSQVVKKLVDKVDPSVEEMDVLIRSASKGLDIQTKRREIREVGEYQDLLYYLQGKSFAKMEANWPKEASITVGGRVLSPAQSASVRVAVSGMLMELQDPEHRQALGEIAGAYEDRLREVELLLLGDIQKSGN